MRLARNLRFVITRYHGVSGETPITDTQKPRIAGLFNAPRETRTPTGHTAHKALTFGGGVS